MSNPKHKNPNVKNRVAVAPYNFVPLPEKIVSGDSIPPQDNYTGYTGYFECELETCSPTYVRGMQTPQQFADGETNPQPFSLDGGQTPTIPGSSLRGMFRTLMEIVTYAKMGAVTKEPLVYRAVGDTSSQGDKYRQRIMHSEMQNHYEPKVQGGFIRQVGEKWYIQPAPKIGGTTFARIRNRDIPAQLSRWHNCKNAHKIYIHPGPYQYQSVRGGFLQIKYSKVLRVSHDPNAKLMERAVLARSGWMIKKNSEAIIFGQPDDNDTLQEDWIPIPDYQDYEQSGGETPDLVGAYRNQLSKEQKTLLGENGVLQNMQPIFYLCEKDETGEEKLVFFGHTMMMRLPYLKAPYDLMPAHLQQESEIDLVEAMFGYVDKKVSDPKKKACAGRLFFTNATCLAGQSEPIMAEMSPHILATPNPTTFQHYLTQPYPDDPKNLRDYDSDDTTLRGFKMYWHKGAEPDFREMDEKKLKLDRAKVESKQQYTIIQPIRTGVKFRFLIRFENLTDIELGALSWLLQLGNRPHYRFKLGMGKPLGLGAVKITPTLQLTDRQARYKQLFTENDWHTAPLSDDRMTEIQQNALTAFEQCLLTDSEINPDQVGQVADIPRIQMLLQLLSWPGPNPDLTRYLEIEHFDPKEKRGKRNEYRDRPVLPDPLHVGRETSGQPVLAPRDPQADNTVYSSSKTEQSADVVSTDKVLAMMAERTTEREAKERQRKLSKIERQRQKRQKKKKK